MSFVIWCEMEFLRNTYFLSIVVRSIAFHFVQNRGQSNGDRCLYQIVAKGGWAAAGSGRDVI